MLRANHFHDEGWHYQTKCLFFCDTACKILSYPIEMLHNFPMNPPLQVFPTCLRVDLCVFNRCCRFLLCAQMRRRVATSCTSCLQSGSATASTWARRRWSWSSSHWSATVTSSARAIAITLCFRWSTSGLRNQVLPHILCVVGLIAPKCERSICFLVNHAICIPLLIMTCLISLTLVELNICCALCHCHMCA